MEWQPLSHEATEALLSTAHEANFVLYCALLSVELQEAENCLLLNIQDRYTYEVLRLERNSAALGNLLSHYEGGIFLRRGPEAFACPRPTGKKSPPSEPKSEPAQELTPELTPESASEPYTMEPDIEPEPEPEAAPNPNTLPFNGLLQEVSRLMGGEVMLIRRGASPEEAESGNDSGDSGSDDENDE